MKVYLPDTMASWVMGKHWIPCKMQHNRVSIRSIQHKNLAKHCMLLHMSKL